MAKQNKDRDIAEAINRLCKLLEEAELARDKRDGADWYWGLKRVPVTITSTSLPPEMRAELDKLLSEGT